MLSPSLIKEFQRLLGPEQVFQEETDRATYAYDAAVLDPVMPAIVLKPGSPEELGQVVRLCQENGLSLTVRGAGTNLSGGSIPGRGGAVVLTTALNKILEINEADLYAVVQPGVVTAKLAAAVEAKGLFYPPDPGSMAPPGSKPPKTPRSGTGSGAPAGAPSPPWPNSSPPVYWRTPPSPGAGFRP